MDLPVRLKNFFTFYVLAFLLHYTEEWDHPETIIVFMGLAALVIGSDFQPWTILVFSLAAHLQIFLFHFPDTANHIRVFIGCNLAVTVFSGALVFRKPTPGPNDKIYASFTSTLMLALVVTYLYAGFHKLNWGFLDPEYSCATNFVRRMLRAFWMGDLEIPKGAFPALVGFVYAWELIIPFFMLFRRTQVVALPVCIGMHWLLAPTGFLDFASLAWAILILFFDDRYHEVIEERPLRMGALSITRRRAFFVLTMLGGVIAGIHFRLLDEDTFFESWPKGVETFTGLLFIASAVMFLWPAIRETVREHGFRGIDLKVRRIHWAYWTAFAFVVINGFQPYLGLSTGGAYSMFSNLRTEGPTSNHLVLGSNPFKVFGLQEDVVVIHTAPSWVTDHGLSIEGYDVPMVEFRKMLFKWRRRGNEIPIDLQYGRRRYRTANILEHPDWQLERKWYDRLLDFRIIPREGPNRCQW